MIINWLLYSILVGGILAIAGVAFEYGARALRLPTRWVWMVVMVLSTAFSALTLAKGLVTRTSDEPAIAYAVPVAGSAIDADSVPMRVWNARESSRVRPWNRAKPKPLQPVIETVLNSTGGFPAAIGVDARSYRSSDTPLLIGCGVLALLGMVTLVVTFARLSGVAYALDHAVIEGVPVLLSRNIGPALLGVTRFRVVLPRWVTEMSSADVRTILAHEQEHALAGDPTLTLGALVMAALQPWNPALWFALARLRLATEADCDARVLGVDGDVRRYGHLLVNVYQRAQSGLSPLTSFVTRTSQLEARIRRMVNAAPKSFSPKTVGAFAAALLLCTLAYSLEVTAQRSYVFAEEMAMDSAAAMAPAAPQVPAKAKVQQDSTRRAKSDSAKPAVKLYPRVSAEDNDLAKAMNALDARSLQQQKTKPDSAQQLRAKLRKLADDERAQNKAILAIKASDSTRRKAIADSTKKPAQKSKPDTARSAVAGSKKYYDVRQTDLTPLHYSDSAMAAGLRAITTDSAKAAELRINRKLDSIAGRMRTDRTPDSIRAVPVKGRGAGAVALVKARGGGGGVRRAPLDTMGVGRRMPSLADSARRIIGPDSTR